MFDFLTRRKNLSRAGMAETTPATEGTDYRVHVDLPYLQSLEGPAQRLNLLPKQPAHSVLAGRHGSKLRGRGLNFEELREYWPSDDVRAIDWNVTARTGEPHVRIYTEERDRPALIVVDQRMSMYFGTRHKMKSVTAAEAAALAAFAILHQDDRVGGVVVTDTGIVSQRPRRSRTALTHFLAAVASANQRLHANAPVTPPTSLDAVLKAVAQIARRDHLILLISDFDITSDATTRLIGGIAQRNDMILVPVSDPTGHSMPKGFVSAISDGKRQAILDTGNEATHGAMNTFNRARHAVIQDWHRRFGLPIAPLSAAEDTLPQLRQLLGLVSATAASTVRSPGAGVIDATG